jgi:uncharacterized protein (DUF305 family)
MKRILAALASAAVASIGLTGCVVNLSDQTVPQVDGGSTTTTTSTFDHNDIMFAQMMIPHHTQAVELATLALSNTTTPAILDLASRIAAAQQPEIDLMTSWVDSSGMGMDMGSEMSMPGLVSDADMEIIRAATGTDFDALFLTDMIAHHEGAISMANDVLATTKSAEVTALAHSIVTSQSAEIQEMYALLGP